MLGIHCFGFMVGNDGFGLYLDNFVMVFALFQIVSDFISILFGRNGTHELFDCSALEWFHVR